MAVKRLRARCRPADFEHLRSIRHPNLVSFKGVASESFLGDSSHHEEEEEGEKEERGCQQQQQLSSCCLLVMEYCPFGQLCEHLASVEALAPSRLADWSRQLASGMAYLHGQRIIHRDLKSPNVLISHGQLLKVCDFDTSHRLRKQVTVMATGENASISSALSRQMSLAGTVAWMAPEMIRNERCSEKIDIW